MSSIPSFSPSYRWRREALTFRSRELNRDSQDDSRTGVNIRVFPAFLQGGREDARERDIADLLGLTVDQVKRRIVDVDTAAELSRNFGEPADTLLGKSDSLAKPRCGSAPVTTAGGRQTLAPFAFVSSLA